MIEARERLAGRRVDQEWLAGLYQAYNPVPDPAAFIQSALCMFPTLCCGVASVYLQHRLGEGIVHCGSYRGVRHTYLVARGWIVDVTADQFGGPRAYYGPLVQPWRWA